MIETIRIDRDYPTYAGVLMPAARWDADPYATVSWAFETTNFYQTLYSPKRDNGMDYDWCEESESATFDVFQTGVSLLSGSYEFTASQDVIDERKKAVVDEFFAHADEFFYTHPAAEELLRLVVRHALDVRRMAEITSGAEAIK